METRDGKAPLISGHAAVFNQLSDNLGGFREKILPGAFTDAIQNDDVRALFNHDPNIILGRNKAGTLRLMQDDHGLRFEIDAPDTQACRDLQVSIGRGDISQCSFGFRVMPGDAEWTEDAAGNITRTVRKAGLFDVSPVTYPAYPQTDCATRSMAEWKESTKRNSEEFEASLQRYLRAGQMRFGPVDQK